MPDDNPNDKAVSAELLDAITEVQSLPAFTNFSLAGGTNLAIRYNHRRSIDIDLFSSCIIGLEGLKGMKRELEKYFPIAPITPTTISIFCPTVKPGYLRVSVGR